MKRKDFIRKSLKIGLAAGALSALPRLEAEEQTAAAKAAPAAQAAEKKFREAWIETLMMNMETKLDPGTRNALMESCGRACARRSSMMKLAESCQGDVGTLMKTLTKFLGEKGNSLEGKIVHLSYPKCYCELVADGPERLPETYCHCSEGWVREIFETAARKKVQVETIQTIKRGASSCLFRITI